MCVIKSHNNKKNVSNLCHEDTYSHQTKFQTMLLVAPDQELRGNATVTRTIIQWMSIVLNQ